ncbi:Exosome complex component RRP42 [Rhizophlyctis rosea]|nr:Exosome complex component RRP42 [Rhizophlyctis rosea]
MISVSERDFITKGVDVAVRADGRGRHDLRALVVETGLITQASGSARARIAGGTDVLVGVKTEVGSIDPELDADEVEEPDVEGLEEAELGGRDRDRGRIVCTVDCSQSANRIYNSRELEDICNEYAQILNRVLNGPQGGVDLKSLFIVKGNCWILNIDVVILEHGGNVLDTIFIATRAALHNTRIPRVTIEESDGHTEFDIADEETEIVRGWEDVPLCITLNKIGMRHVVDATLLEELCSNAKLRVAVNRRGNLCLVQKGGVGGIEPSLLAEMIQTSKTIAAELIKALDAILEEERIARRREEPVGFKLG